MQGTRIRKNVPECEKRPMENVPENRGLRLCSHMVSSTAGLKRRSQVTGTSTGLCATDK